MKKRMKKMLPLLMVAVVLAMGATTVSCKSSSQSNKGGERMYQRHQSNKAAKVKSNIKVKGSNKANGHTTRSY